MLPGTPDHRPRIPASPPGIGILGCGRIARSAHLPAYRQYGLPVVGVWSRSGTRGVLADFPEVMRSYQSAEELLRDPAVTVVDLATGPTGRVDWIARCVEAGKHVLVQKPLVDDWSELDRLMPVLDRADAAGVVVAVNQNARWAPTWRLATRLVEHGAIGKVVGVTHLHDKSLPPIVGTPFDDVQHMLISDYLMHWIDITCLWLGSPVTRVAALDSRLPGQPSESRNPWAAVVNLCAENGATATLRVSGNAVASRGGCPFWIHGTEGTLRGSILLGSDRLTLERDGQHISYDLQGQWFVDGFAGTMGELMSAIAESREPENSARLVAPSVQAMLAAVDSARADGRPEQVS
ncbi:Gfo/Idh/MocA family oxidoreductase [Luteococcus sp. H138]|uniref:Gfo/Idh/MocA family protein n=1 Tax=unclassified Luteococcus TaxID=2639923 RepID=UPI00313D39DE